MNIAGDKAAPSAARLRIRVIGRFSSAPAGRTFFVSPATFAAEMEHTGLSASVTVTDRLGGAEQRQFELSLPRLRAFQLAGIADAAPVLAELNVLARSLNGPERPSPDRVVGRVRELTGDGVLSTAGEAALVGPPSRDSAAEKPPAPAQSTAVAAVVHSLRSDNVPSGIRVARRAIEETLFATAADILKDAAIAQFESAWRGLKLLVDQCSTSTEIAIEVVDVDPAGVVAALTANLAKDAFDEPDLFVVDCCNDVATLTQLADIAENVLAPVLVGLQTSVTKAETEDQPFLNGWSSNQWEPLRSSESSRWLGVVSNRVVVAAEGSGAARHICFASGAFVVSAMLVKLFRETGGFGGLLGTSGALESPATQEISSGHDAGVTVPTEEFLRIPDQQTLASLGITGLGSGRDTNKVMLAAAPTVHASKDALPIAAQIWSGRIVRFAKWVRDQVPHGSTPGTVSALFSEAADAFLFNRVQRSAEIRTAVGTTDGTRVVEVLATLGAELAGIPFQMAFTLPLRD